MTSILLQSAIAAALDDVYLRFGEREALRGMSFSIRAGEMFGIVGPDGAGKTTAIRLMLGLLRADSGTVRVLGHNPIVDAKIVKPQLGYLSQRFTLYGDLTVRENIEFFAELHHVRDLSKRLPGLLDFTLLGPYQQRRADKLSGGMQKKLALACTLVHQPEIIFLDEPTTGVDPISRREFWSLLHTLMSQGLTVVLSTPYLDEAERCTRVALVRAGQTLALDKPETLRKSSNARLVEVVCSPLRLARDRLQASPRVASVHLFGDRLRARPLRQDDDLADLVDALNDASVLVHSRRTVLPSLEDVFIDMVQHATAQENSGADQ